MRGRQTRDCALPEKTLAELSIPELYRIAWQGRDTLAPLSRSALAALMEFRLSLEPALPRMDRMAGPQLDDVRRALQSAYVEEGGEPECWRTAGAYRALASSCSRRRAMRWPGKISGSGSCVRAENTIL